MKFARAALLALAIPGLLSAQATIGSGGGSEIFFWGKPDTQTYGQTFATPAGNTRLDNISFWLGGGSSLSFRAYVYAWDAANTRATGSALFTSAVAAAPGGSGFQRVDIATGGVELAANTAYVAFLSTSGLPGSGQIAWESTGSNGYDDGAFVFINNDEDVNAWTTGVWNTDWQGPGSDLRFEMGFNQSNVVPEPSTYALMATGLAGLAGLARRRRRV